MNNNNTPNTDDDTWDDLNQQIKQAIEFHKKLADTETLTDKQARILKDHNPCSFCEIDIKPEEKWSLQVGGGGEGDYAFAGQAAGDIFIFHDKCHDEHMASLENKP